MLTEDQIEHYYREGYVMVPGLVPRRSIEAVMEVAPAYLTGNTQWQAKTFKHDSPDEEVRLHQLLADPRIIEAVTQLLGVPPRVFHGMLAIVAPHGGHGLPWHQDNQHTHILGGALNVFIALREITFDKGGLWVAPRSHLLGRQPFTHNQTTAPGLRETLVEPENGIPLPTMQPGDACIFDRYTMHRSLQNRTEEPRYAYAAQFQSAHARVADTGKQDSLRMLAAELGEHWLQLGLPG